MDDKLNRLRAMLEQSERIVFLGGAGLSTESGIPDFRGERGVFAALKAYGQPPEVLLSHSYFRRHMDVFFDYYRKYLLWPEAQPNEAHFALARLERQGKLKAVITQNIDGLHAKAGSRNVLELHGSVYRNHCMACGRFYPMEAVVGCDGVPRCNCGGVIKPDVILYEESLDEGVLSAAIRAIRDADMLLIGGTQLSVYPAAGLVDYFTGRNIAVINLSETARDTGAVLTIHEKIGEVLKTVIPENGQSRNTD